MRPQCCPLLTAYGTWLDQAEVSPVSKPQQGTTSEAWPNCW